ncbi:MAG: carboxylesterase/lipase family protein, partial [Lachnospiraceae bacterium]|nr:carboxylesterase/lipase family protein [Lachnospiraceae bacterium]
MSDITIRRDCPIVETDKGKLRGFLFKGIYNFYGVRYATAKRFHQPEPVEAWEGIKDATAYGYISPVLSNPRPSGEVKIPHRFWPSSEDCLNLNLWTPSLDKDAKKPVIVWYHGGGFANGSALEQVCYDGQALATEQDVVVITVNHRLNVFGFLDVSDFGPEYENSGNAGVADLVASLQWVHNNVAAFGGDPENVTIMGQSGGGGKVNTLAQTPAAAGLFHKAVLLSGGMGGIRMRNNPAPSDILPKAIMEEAGVSTIQELEEVPVALFIRAVNIAGKKLEAEGYSFFWGPKANGWYLGDPMSVGVSDYYKKVPTLGGT